MRYAILCVWGAISFAIVATTANAAVFGFVNNPTTNSTDWAASVVANGGGAGINTSVNFDSHPTGALVPGFYSGSAGVTLTPSGDVNTVQIGGVAQLNTSQPPLSPGEGPHASSNFLFDGGSASSLTISFNAPVLGAGLFIFDYFNPFGNNPLTIEAFNGIGNSLGLFSAAAFNFQPDNMYFMGVVSTAQDISSLVFTDVNSNTGDTTGIDDIRFARGAAPSSVPEPGALALFAAAFGALGMSRRRNKT
jgi:hypothetical protein